MFALPSFNSVNEGFLDDLPVNKSIPFDPKSRPIGPGQAGSTDIPWLTFSGSPHESVSTFIQSVQRVAVQLSYMYEDGWIAHYAAGCFSADSLLWYSDLDEETCNSWRKLRKALLQQYHHKDVKNQRFSTRSIARSLDSPGTPGPLAAAPALQESPPSSTKSSSERRGRIEVFLYNYPVTVGFLAYDRESSMFSIVQDTNQALVISFPKHTEETPFNIRMEGLPEDTRYPYLGLVVRIAGAKIPVTAPPVLLTSMNYLGCKSLPSSHNFYRHDMNEGQYKPNVTWIFRSPTSRYRRIARTVAQHERASSAVWQYHEKTNQLSMTWMMDDDAEMGLEAIVADGERASLQVYQGGDWRSAGWYTGESRVKLYFVSDESD
ncbi:hypothetical protein M407DRAFT_19047 [Tulasnella calospora MUT 4182]|uniref:Uncharacterized protein n=1 Tax=Tulasnella calospora MUT 4182 TaxID=1051891 RepID=A0A0C3QSN9_9AGAM|nr:hypothetical protein M407DRAFT_19047 [Tulasnella calospora MUT 4182]